MNTTTISLTLWDGAHIISFTPSQRENSSGRKPTLKNESLCSTIDVLIIDGALIASSRDFLFGFDFRAVPIWRFMPCGDKKLVWKSFQTNQLLSHCAVVSHSGSTELTHTVLELQRVIVCQSNSLLANHYELKDSKSSLKQKLAEDLLEIHQSSLRRKFHSTSIRQ